MEDAVCNYEGGEGKFDASLCASRGRVGEHTEQDEVRGVDHGEGIRWRWHC